MALHKIHYTRKNNQETIETGVLKGKTRHDVFLNAMSTFGHCIGAVKDDEGETQSWVFSCCQKEGNACKIIITHCELL